MPNMERHSMTFTQLNSNACALQLNVVLHSPTKSAFFTHPARSEAADGFRLYAGSGQSFKRDVSTRAHGGTPDSRHRSPARSTRSQKSYSQPKASTSSSMNSGLVYCADVRAGWPTALPAPVVTIAIERPSSNSKVNSGPMSSTT